MGQPVTVRLAEEEEWHGSSVSYLYMFSAFVADEYHIPIPQLLRHG